MRYSDKPDPKLVLEASDLGQAPLTVGRYVLHRQIARGGMATIHVARLMGDEGFSRIVAAKRLHAEFAEDAEFVAMFLDEARIASKVQHRNVVPVLDVVTTGEEVILVQEYVHGAPLQWLLRSAQQSQGHVPINIAVSIACQVLSGLHATHETVDELGQPMEIVHRDVSPQNVMVAMDGTARLLDFGVAKAIMAAHVTREGTYKGKLAYSAPEQLRGAATRQSDVYSLSVLLWELLVGQRMHRMKSGSELVESVLNGVPPTIREALSVDGVWDTISSADRRQLQVLDPVVRKGLAVDMKERWATAAEMEEALAEAARPASPSAVAAWLKSVGKDFIDKREGMIAAEEASWRKIHPVGSGRSLLTLHNSSSVNLRVPGTPSVQPGEIVRSQFHSQRNPKLLVAALCSLIAVLSLGVILLAREPSAQRETAVQAAAPRVAAIAERPADAETQLVPKAEEEPAIERPSAPSPTSDMQRPALVPAEAAPTLVHHRASEPKELRMPRKIRSAAIRTSEPETPQAPPAEVPSSAAIKASTDCSTPYYFQGTKKIFKPACL